MRNSNVRIDTFRIDNYVQPSDASHVAHKYLPSRWPEAAHDHDYFEIFLVESGRTDHWINASIERLRRGHLAFIRPTDAHAFRADAKLGCRIYNVMFRQETVEHFNARYAHEFSGRFFDSTEVMPDTYILKDALFDRALRLCNRLMDSTLSLAQVEEFLLALGNQVLASLSRREQHVPGWLADACELLNDPINFRQGTAGFVAVAGKSHEHLCRSCKEHLGCTPSAYVNKIRMSYAADRLVRTHLPITQIVEEIGIDSVGHFYRLFQQQLGKTPRAYRVAYQRNPF